MPGWDPKWDWRGFVPPEALPRQYDPPEAVIITANHDLNHLGDVRPINAPMADYRARRIAEMLEEGPCDLATCARIQMDTFSIQAAEMMEFLRPVLPDTPAGRELAGWNCRYDLDSRGAVLFESFYRELLIEIFGSMGEAVIRHLSDATGIFIDFYANFDRVLTAPSSPWLAGRSLDVVYRSAFERVDETEQRRWGDVNSVLFVNILLGGRLPKWAGFDRGPIAIPGGRATPHQGQIYESAGRQTSFVPVLRVLADLGQEGLHTSLAGGPSDNRFSRWYASDRERWRRGEYKLLARLNDDDTQGDRARDADSAS